MNHMAIIEHMENSLGVIRDLTEEPVNYHALGDPERETARRRQMVSNLHYLKTASDACLRALANAAPDIPAMIAELDALAQKQKGEEP